MSNPSSELGVIVGGSRYGSLATGTLRHYLDMVDLDQPDLEPGRIELSFLAHGFALNPTKLGHAVLLEKHGVGGAYVDLRSRGVDCLLVPSPEHEFYGHGTFLSGASAFLAIESRVTTKAGIISLRDAKTFAIIDRFPTYGRAPHDCCLVDGGNTLAVTNGGGPIDSDAPSVTFIDIATRKLLETFEVPNPRINAGHVAIVRDREFVVVSAPREGLPAEAEVGGVSIRRLGKPFAYAGEPREVVGRMLGESLSVCIHDPSRTALTTHPYGNLITFWNMDHGALFGALDVAHARGATLTKDGRMFVVSFATTGGLLLIDANPLQIRGPVPQGAGRLSGSHIYNWDRAAALNEHVTNP